MRHIFHPTKGRLPNKTSRIVIGGTEAQNQPKALENLHGIDVDTIGQPDGILGLNGTGRLYFENANLSTLFPIPKARGPSSVYANHKAYYLITNYDINKEYVVEAIGNGLATLERNTVSYIAPNAPSTDGDGFTVNGEEFPINILVLEITDQVLEPSIIVPNTPLIDYSEELYRFESTDFRYTGALQHHLSSSWEIATDVNFSDVITSIANSQTYKTYWELTGLETDVLFTNTNYYIRVRHTGDLTGNSNWSSFIKFKIKEQVATELPWVKKPSIISYLPQSSSIVHPPFIMYGIDPTPNTGNEHRSILIGTDGYPNACSLNNTAVVNSKQYIKNPYINYPSAGRHYDVGMTVNAIKAIGTEVWFLGNGIAKFNPTTDTFTELFLDTDIIIPITNGLIDVCQYGGSLYGIGSAIDYLYIYDESGTIPEFKPIITHGLPIQSYSSVTVSNNDTYATARYVGIYKRPNGSNDFQLFLADNKNWSSITDVNGSLYTTEQDGNIYKFNTDTSVFDSLNQTTRDWSGITSLGTDIYACVLDGDIYKQTNGTGNFVPLGQTARLWSSIYSDGTDVYACVNNGNIYKQTNGTGDFTTVTVDDVYDWSSVAKIGDDIYASTGPDIYKKSPEALAFTKVKTINEGIINSTTITSIFTDGTNALISTGTTIHESSDSLDTITPIGQIKHSWSSLCSSNGNLYASEVNLGVYTINAVNGTMTNIHDSSLIQGSYTSLSSLNNKLYIAAGHIYKETNTPNTFIIEDDSKSSYIELASSNDHMFVRSYENVIYKQTNSIGAFNAIVTNVNQIDSMTICNGLLYTHVSQVANYVPVQNGLGRYNMDGLPIYDDKNLLGNIQYKNTLLSSTFESVGGPQDHILSSWEIALDTNFDNIVYKVVNDTVYLTNVELSNIPPNIMYYGRVKHTGSIWGDSEWSNPYQFTFTNFTIPSNDFYDQILEDKSTDILGNITHSTAVNSDGTIVAITTTEVQYNGFVDTDALLVIYAKVNGNWVRDGEFSISGITQYGISLAINDSGNKLFIGAPFDNDFGTVYLYERDEMGWYESNVFQDPVGGSDEGGGSECFGVAVACNSMGDRVAIGRSAISSAHYPGLSTNGSVHVYDLGLDGIWDDPKTIIATDPQMDSGFGLSLSMSNDGSVLAIGAPKHNFNTGKAYIAHYENTNWTITQELLPHDTSADIGFSYSLALSGDTSLLYVGAPYYDNNTDQNNPQTSAGAVYVYQKDLSGINYHLLDQWVHYIGEDTFGKSISTSVDGSVTVVATSYKSLIYQNNNDVYVLNSMETIRDIDIETSGRIYNRVNSISKSGSCLVQSLSFDTGVYNNYIHIKSLHSINTYPHISTDWQIAADYKFNNILINVVNDVVNKETFVSPAIFPMRTTVYVRSRYNSEVLGYTPWSLPFAVITVGGE